MRFAAKPRVLDRVRLRDGPVISLALAGIDLDFQTQRRPTLFCVDVIDKLGRNRALLELRLTEPVRHVAQPVKHGSWNRQRIILKYLPKQAIFQYETGSPESS